MTDTIVDSDSPSPASESIGQAPAAAVADTSAGRARVVRRVVAVAAAAAVAAAGYGVYATTLGVSSNAGTDEQAGTTEALDTTIGCQTDPVTVAPVYRDNFATTDGYTITLTGFRLTGLSQTCLDSGTTAMLAYDVNGTWQELPTPLTLSNAVDGTLITPVFITAAASMNITGYSLRLAGGTAPAAPAILTATNGNTLTEVTWTPPPTSGTTPVTGYQYTLNGGATWTPLSSTTSPVTIAGLTNNTTYTLAIRAVNTTGPGPASNTVTITPQATNEDTPADIIITGTNTGL